jgi:hypothetical protein
MNFKSLGLAAVAAVAIALPAWAHHSHANYEAIKWADLKGKVTEVQWLNPHVWLYFDVVNPKTNQAEQWTLDGDDISVKCHLAKDGSNNCLLGFLTTPGGQPKEFD